eukprot:5261683-Amphidinium_carterae.1
MAAKGGARSFWRAGEVQARGPNMSTPGQSWQATSCFCSSTRDLAIDEPPCSSLVPLALGW